MYSCSGKQINRINVCDIDGFKKCYVEANFIQWESATIRGVGWSDKEELLVVAEDGTVRRYFGLDGEFTSFSLGNVRPPLGCG